jgi:hypothetical protein
VVFSLIPTKNLGTYLAVLSFGLLLVSLWQIEEIWRSLQNGWKYNLPFGQSSEDYWFWHDVWFCVIGVAWLLLLLVAVEQKR